jgi:hypothetical protein
MRSILSVLFVLVGLTAAAAQPSASAIQAELEQCRRDLQQMEWRLRDLFEQHKALEGIYGTIAAQFTEPGNPKRVFQIEEELRPIGRRVSEVALELRTIEARLPAARRRCEDLGTALARLRNQDSSPRTARLARDVRRRIDSVDKAIQLAQARLEETWLRLAELRQRLAVRPDAPPGAKSFGWRFSAIADLGQPFTSSPKRRFAAFAQTLEEKANAGWHGTLGLQIDSPAIIDTSQARIWVSAAATALYLQTELHRVVNDAGGQVSSRGDDILRGVGFLIGLGGSLFPNHPILSRWEWQAMGGVGYAKNSLRGVGPAGGEQFSASQHVAPRLARLALYYSITNDVRAGLALSLVTTPGITGRLPNGTQFQIGSITNYIAAISLAYAFSSSSRGPLLPPLR